MPMSFIKRHKILFVIFLICILLMIKNSSIPYFFTPPALISFIFDAPKDEFFSSVAQIVDMFDSAYVTSLLFYYMVDYLPAINQEKKSKDIIMPKLVNLYLYISEFLAMIEYSAVKQNLAQSGDIREMNKLSITNQEIKCKLKTFKNEKESGTAAYSYNLLINADQFRTLVLNTCSEISCTPSFTYCDTKLIHLISEIQLSELLRMWPKPNDPMTRFNTEYMGLGEGYQTLKSIYNRLSMFVETRISYEMIDISPEEVEEWQKQQSEAFRQYPELVDALVAFNKNSKS